MAVTSVAFSCASSIDKVVITEGTKYIPCQLPYCVLYTMFPYHQDAAIIAHCLSTSCSSERSFSGLKRITAIRFNMKNKAIWILRGLPYWFIFAFFHLNVKIILHLTFLALDYVNIVIRIFSYLKSEK